MKDLTYLGALSFPNYPRQIKLSNAQRPKYFEWDGITIKSGSKKLLQKYINQKKRKEIDLRKGKVIPSDLKHPYTIVEFRGSHPYIIEKNKSNITKIVFSLTPTQLKGKKRNILCGISLKNGDINIEKIISNPTQQGKPKMKIITGQDFHVGLHPHIRAKVVTKLHNFYNNTCKSKMLSINFDKFREILNKNYPLYIEMEIQDTVKNVFDNTKEGNGKRWDVGNRALPYMKTFLDFLGEGSEDFEPFIIDDDRLHVSSGNNSIFNPIEYSENRQLVFHFYKNNNKNFLKYLNNDNSS